MRARPGAAGKPKPCAGYFFRAMERNERDQPLGQDTDGADFYGAVHSRSEFALVAYPAEQGKTGRMTFIMNAENTVWWKDTGGKPVLRFPDDPGRDGWERAHR